MSEFSVYRSFTPTVKPTRTLQEHEKNETRERRRNLLYLIVSYLRERNLLESADVLITEAQLTSQYEVCDNIDLDIIFQDYQSYYNIRFHKTPKVVKKVAEIASCETTPAHKKKSLKSSTFSAMQMLQRTEGSQHENVTNFRIDITSLSQKGEATNSSRSSDQENERVLNSKALCDFKGYTSEWREMAELIIREIVPKNLGMSWADCVGVQDSIELLKETVVYPVRYPELFSGLTAPWRGVLLYGPPGTGKTHLAKAVACESSSTFINVRSSSFISKWRGESERMLKVLFDVAKYYAPTTIFVDEVDAIASRQDDCSHDASRRFKSELLIQMDGILNENEQVFVLATTNAPWNIDPALLRRFEKRILLSVPSVMSRRELFRHFFCSHANDFDVNDFNRMAELTDQFSGSDIKQICKEVMMSILRETLGKLKPGSYKGGIKQLRKPLLGDVFKAIEKTNATTKPDVVQRYVDWQKSYGSL